VFVLDSVPQIKLNNGAKIPQLGFGTWKLREGSEAENAVKWAIEAGYRLIDTAAIYGNEESVGKAIAESGVPRKELFVTTKLWNNSHERVEQAFDESLEKLGLDYVNLYLIHWPVEKRIETWRKLEKILESGRARGIGVSNFTVYHLEDLLDDGVSVVPAANQVEFSPFLYQKGLLEYCQKKGIALEAYSPLARTHKFDNPLLKEIASAHSKSPAQVMIRWALQRGLIVIPKSSHKERIKENFEVFDFSLSQQEMSKLDALNENYRTCWDPSGMP